MPVVDYEQQYCNMSIMPINHFAYQRSRHFDDNSKRRCAPLLKKSMALFKFQRVAVNLPLVSALKMLQRAVRC